jgi:uncharacterized protein (DUF4415 family)
MKESAMKRISVNLGDIPELTDEQKARLRALDDVEPDTVDLPEAPAENWKYARQFFKPRKEAVSIRLDADVLDWLRHRGDKYQTEINRILRSAMEAERGR